MSKAFIVLPTITLCLALWYFLYIDPYLQPPNEMPNLDPNEWWGPPGLKSSQDKSIRPFKITFPEKEIVDLKHRLKKHRDLTPPLESVGFQYGFNTKTLENWIKYWSESYNFEERAKFLNQYPQFKTNIQGLDIHFIRVKPQVPSEVEVVPVILLHGWCGSVREFYEAIPFLTKTSKLRNFAVEVIAPSLPGYGFSDAAVKPGLGTAEMAVIFKNLMNRLGYKKYYVQGGDWGAVIGSNMATLFPEEVLGFHTNMAFVMSTKMGVITLLGSMYPSFVVDDSNYHRMYPLEKTFGLLIEESGYFHLQSTKPDTIGISLMDSPAGLLAYILEKFSTWTNHENRELVDGGLEKSYSKEQLLDNVMMYWISNSITTSMRLYAENMSDRERSMRLSEIPTEVPTCIVQAKYELFYQPVWMLQYKYQNLLNTTVLDYGGHFLALELPEVFAEDVIKSIGYFRDYHQNNKDVKTEL